MTFRLLIAGIVGALLTSAPVFGLANACFMLSRTFRILSNEGQGNVDPSTLPHGMSCAFRSIGIGLLLFPFGVVILLDVIVRYSNLRKTLL